MREALGLLIAGDYEAALPLLLRARASEPRVLCHMARALFECGRDDDALAAVQEALSLGASVAFVQLSHALLLLDMGRADEALAALHRAMELDPKNVFHAPCRGIILLALGRRAEGIDLLDRHLMPGPPALVSRACVELETWLGIGEASFEPFVLERSEEPEPALFAALNRILMAPEAAASFAHVFLLARRRLPEHRILREASTHLDRGGARRAVEALRACLQSGSTLTEPLRYALAEAHLLAGEPREALALLPEIQEQASDLFPVAFRAAALFRAGEHEDAERLLEGAGTLMKEEDYSVAYLRGLVALARGQRRRARRAFQEAFRLESPFIAGALVKEARRRP